MFLFRSKLWIMWFSYSCREAKPGVPDFWREGRIVGAGESLPEIITSTSDEPWLLTGMCGPPSTGPPKTGGWREECRQSRGGRLEGGTWGWGANRAGFRGAGVSTGTPTSRQPPDAGALVYSYTFNKRNRTSTCRTKAGYCFCKIWNQIEQHPPVALKVYLADACK